MISRKKPSVLLVNILENCIVLDSIGNEFDDPLEPFRKRLLLFLYSVPTLPVMDGYKMSLGIPVELQE